MIFIFFIWWKCCLVAFSIITALYSHSYLRDIHQTFHLLFLIVLWIQGSSLSSLFGDLLELSFSLTTHLAVDIALRGQLRVWYASTVKFSRFNLYLPCSSSNCLFFQGAFVVWDGILQTNSRVRCAQIKYTWHPNIFTEQKVEDTQITQHILPVAFNGGSKTQAPIYCVARKGFETLIWEWMREVSTSLSTMRDVSGNTSSLVLGAILPQGLRPQSWTWNLLGNFMELENYKSFLAWGRGPGWEIEYQRN